MSKTDVNKQIRDEFSSSPAFAELLVRKEKHWTEFEEKESEEDIFGVKSESVNKDDFGAWKVVLDGVDYSRLVVAVRCNLVDIEVNQSKYFRQHSILLPVKHQMPSDYDLSKLKIGLRFISKYLNIQPPENFPVSVSKYLNGVQDYLKHLYTEEQVIPCSFEYLESKVNFIGNFFVTSYGAGSFEDIEFWINLQVASGAGEVEIIGV